MPPDNASPADAPLDRRRLLGLGAALAGGTGIGWAIRRWRPPGVDAGSIPGFAAIRDDRHYPALGPATADVRIALFTDYRCPACRVSAAAAVAAVTADGAAALSYRDWPIFGAPSLAAARWALAADWLGLYPPFHQQLMRAPTLDEPAIRAAFVAIGGDWPALERARRAHAPAIDRLLAETDRAARQLGIAGTPTYLIGERLVTGALDAGEIGRLVTAARAAYRAR